MSANFESLAKTLSHEIGHSLGASHTEQTSCQSGHYLMSTVADPSNPVTTLSKCTKKTIDKFLKRDLVDQIVDKMANKIEIFNLQAREQLIQLNQKGQKYCQGPLRSTI